MNVSPTQSRAFQQAQVNNQRSPVSRLCPPRQTLECPALSCRGNIAVDVGLVAARPSPFLSVEANISVALHIITLAAAVTNPP